MARLKYGAKKDANHKEIMDVISRLVPVIDLSNMGMGVPDGIAEINGTLRLFDIKNAKTGYGRRGLNPRQKRWADDWKGGPVFLIYTVDEAIAFCKGDLSALKREPDDRRAQKLAEIPIEGEVR